jgi:TRAP-type C4-dicarboxylate transport system substrate-binding protein
MTPTTLTLSHYMPPGHGTHRDFLAPWARALEARADGAIRVTIADGTTALGRLEHQYAQVASGAVDIAHSPAHLPPGRFPATGIAGLPFLAAGADQGTRLLWHLLPDHLAAEYDAFKVLALHADSGGCLHTIRHPIARLEDLAGLRIRVPNPLIAATIEALGAVPVPLAPPEIGEALAAGRLDGAALPWDVLLYTGSDRCFRYHLDTSLYVSPLYLVMNRARYEGLSAALRSAIDAVSGSALVPRFGPWWAAWEGPGRAAAAAPGHTVTRLDPAEGERWRRRVAPVIERRLAELEGQGVAARAIYAAAGRFIAG